jgi:hypothetical protein
MKIKTRVWIKKAAMGCCSLVLPVMAMAANMAVCIIVFLLVLADIACGPAPHQQDLICSTDTIEASR